MATTRICDRCKKIGVEARCVCFSKRKHANQHDGEYVMLTKSVYDLCDECVAEVEKMITGEDLTDKVIYD